MVISNPFITHGYHSPHLFCDREEETRRLTELVVNGNNVALMSPRRLGKTGLLYHCFQQDEIRKNYYTFIVDIYATKNLNELVYEFGKNVLDSLKSKGRKAWELFLNAIGTLRGRLSFDINGVPEWGLGLGDIKAPKVTLDEIFSYLENADKPCVVAIDEFQTIANYPESNVEAELRTRIQKCRNTIFVFTGSQRHIMSEMFVSPSRPFYQSTMLMTIDTINIDRYVEFSQGLFREYNKEIEADAIVEIYKRYKGVTWYVQALLNALFSMTREGQACSSDMIESAISQIISQQSFAYSALLFQIPAKQKEVLMAISKEGDVTNITSREFLNKYQLTASSVQAAIKGLLEKDFITKDLDTYTVYDKFFAQWLLLQ